MPSDTGLDGRTREEEEEERKTRAGDGVSWRNTGGSKPRSLMKEVKRLGMRLTEGNVREREWQG